MPPSAQAPRAFPDTLDISAGESAYIAVLNNDEFAVPDTAITIELVSQPLDGSAEVDGHLIRYSAPTIRGVERFAYAIVQGAKRDTAFVTARIDMGGLEFSNGSSVLRIVSEATFPTPLPADAYRGADIERARVLIPLVNAILRDYGDPTSELGKVRAIRDWVARVSVHPSSFLHPDETTANLAFLPAGATWREANAAADLNVQRDVEFWTSVGYDGVDLLNRLLGTVTPVAGIRADDGLLEHVGGSHYRMRSLESYRFVICNWQSAMAVVLWNALGLHGTVLHIPGHDPAAVFLPSLGRWVYMDPTFNEDIHLGEDRDRPLSPGALAVYSLSGLAGELNGSNRRGPTWSPDHFVGSRRNAAATYFTDNRSVAFLGATWRDGTSGQWQMRMLRFGEIPLPHGDSTRYIRVQRWELFPDLGVRIDDVVALDGGQWTVQLVSSFPGHVRFERRVGGGSWTALAGTIDEVGVGSRVSYRSVDSHGNQGEEAVVEASDPDHVPQ